MLLMGFILPTVKRLQCELLDCHTQIGADDSSANERLEGQNTQLEVQILDAILHFTTNAMISPGGLGGELTGTKARFGLLMMCLFVRKNAK